MRKAYLKNAVEKTEKEAAEERENYASASKRTDTARRAYEKAEKKAAEAQRGYIEQAGRLRRAYNKDAVQEAYYVACAAAYDAAYQTYGDAFSAAYSAIEAAHSPSYSFGRKTKAAAESALNQDFWINQKHRDFYIATFLTALEQADRDRNYSRRYLTDEKTLRYEKTMRYADVYIDSIASDAAYETAFALFKDAYRPDGDEPGADAAKAYAAAGKKAGRIAARESVYLTPPVSIATSALSAAATTYNNYATEYTTYIDSILNQ